MSTQNYSSKTNQVCFEYNSVEFSGSVSRRLLSRHKTCVAVSCMEYEPWFPAVTVPAEPKRHFSEGEFRNWVPYTDTSVPPSLKPEEGKTEETEMEVLYWNSGPVSLKSTPLVVTCTTTEPSSCGGVTQVTSEVDTHVASTRMLLGARTEAEAKAVAEWGPKRQARSSVFRKPDPVTVTTVPPRTAPREGRTD